jgi:hypothetical protein
MSGFPTRIIRSLLGPKFRDLYPAENPETDISAAAFNVGFWQLAGVNLTAARVSLVADWGGSSFTVEHQAEAWIADNAQAHPVLARTSAGVYTYTFASTYENEDGTAIATDLGPPRVTVHKELTAFADRVSGHAWVATGAPLVVQIRIWDASGVAVDEPFWLEVL